jgi:hypothetical protein
MAPEKGALLLSTAGLWSGRASGSGEARAWRTWAVRLRRRDQVQMPLSGMATREEKVVQSSVWKRRWSQVITISTPEERRRVTGAEVVVS